MKQIEVVGTIDTRNHLLPYYALTSSADILYPAVVHTFMKKCKSYNIADPNS